jgi:hypothetical protein
VADKAAVAHVRTIGADADNVFGRSDAVAGTIAQGRVGVAGVVKERTITNGRVAEAGGVVKERLNADGRVEAAGGGEIRGWPSPRFTVSSRCRALDRKFLSDASR